MAHKKKPLGRVMRDITGRTKVGTKTVRLLSCGHTQPENSGGAAHAALTAYCGECTVQALAEKAALVLENDSGSPTAKLVRMTQKRLGQVSAP